MRMLLDIVRQSLSTLWAHKLRSFLTMFGIAWGVGSLLLLVGLGEGFRSGQEKELANLGQNIMFMFPGRIPAVEGSTQSGQTYYFTYKDYLAIRDEAKYVGALSPVLNREDIRAVSDYGSTNGQIFGVAADYNQILHTEAKTEIHQIIARRHGFNPKLEDAFEDWDTIENMKRVGRIFDAMDWFLGVVGVVTLGLGAIGIINIMLVSVTERTKEIGLRKALGATYRAILTQFFIEGAFLTAFSGGIGLAIATVFVPLLVMLSAPEGFDTPRIIPASAFAAIVSLAIAGIAAGLYPARKAALLPPVEALRQE